MGKTTKVARGHTNTSDLEDLRASYLPSQPEIRRACLKIQSTWSDAERASREACSKEWVDGLFVTLQECPNYLANRKTLRTSNGEGFPSGLWNLSALLQTQ